MTQWHFTAPAPVRLRLCAHQSQGPYPPPLLPLRLSPPALRWRGKQEPRGIGDRERKGEKQKGTATEQLIRWDAGTGRVRVSAFIFCLLFSCSQVGDPGDERFLLIRFYPPVAVRIVLLRRLVLALAVEFAALLGSYRRCLLAFRGGRFEIFSSLRLSVPLIREEGPD